MQAGERQDGELLREYLDGRSESAFAELVRRHLDLVYSTAIRIVRNAELARDVSQEVFLKLATQAGSLRQAEALPAWLYRVTHAQAANAVRSEQRRRLREQESMRMSELDNDTDAIWASLKPWLDEAMGTLEKTEQAAVVLRYFSGKKLADVGQILGLREEAARKRVSRGIDKLRTFFARRGLQVGAPSLVTVLGAQTVQSAPVGLAAAITSASLAGAATAGSAGLFASLTQTAIMTNTTITVAGLLIVGAAIAPFILKNSRAGTQTSPTPPVQVADPFTPATSAPATVARPGTGALRAPAITSKPAPSGAERLRPLSAGYAAGARDPTPLEQALSRWRQGDHAGAIEQFLKIDWKAGPALSAHSPLKVREEDFPGMSAPAREKLMSEVLPLLQDLKKLAVAVKEKALTITSTDAALAKSYLVKLADCGAAIDSPEGLKIVQLTAQSLRKMAGADSPRK